MTCTLKHPLAPKTHYIPQRLVQHDDLAGGATVGAGRQWGHTEVAWHRSKVHRSKTLDYGKGDLIALDYGSQSTTDRPIVVSANTGPWIWVNRYIIHIFMQCALKIKCVFSVIIHQNIDPNRLKILLPGGQRACMISEFLSSAVRITARKNTRMRVFWVLRWHHGLVGWVNM